MRWVRNVGSCWYIDSNLKHTALSTRGKKMQLTVQLATSLAVKLAVRLDRSGSITNAFWASSYRAWTICMMWTPVSWVWIICMMQTPVYWASISLSLSSLLSLCVLSESLVSVSVIRSQFWMMKRERKKERQRRRKRRKGEEGKKRAMFWMMLTPWHTPNSSHATSKYEGGIDQDASTTKTVNKMKQTAGNNMNIKRRFQICSSVLRSHSQIQWTQAEGTKHMIQILPQAASIS